MSAFASCLYAGTVVHKRLSPRLHGFAYRVFALCLDVDEIDRIDRELWLFSRNRRNLLGIRDRDLGAPGPGTVAEKMRAVLAGAGLSAYGDRIMLLCYPRLLGYVFNPLSVYFCHDSSGRIGVLAYEVSNTFGERKSYVIPVDGMEGCTVAQDCAKEMYVSPFTAAEGRYSFHVALPCDRVVVGVAFREGDRPTLKTHFRGERVPLSDGHLARLVARHPLMTLKVISAIHIEAARLWGKGVPLVARHASPAYSFTIVKPLSDAQHA
jgi:hypothetical protein